MKKSRLLWEEITPTRVIEAFVRRVKEIPHYIAWKSNMGLSRKNKILLKQLHNKHQNQRCFILANGPSLKDIDFSLLKNEITIGMNRIYLLFDKMQFIPTYYVCINELILDQFHQEIDAVETTKFLNWRTRKYFTKQPQTLFFKENYTVNDVFKPDITDSTTTGATVTYAALQMAFYMGFKQVIIIGMDHSFVEKGVPSKTEVRSSEKDESHFHPNYFPKGIKWQLPDLNRSDIDYQLALDHYTKNEREILDATPKGNCQIFKKVNYNDLFGNNK